MECVEYEECVDTFVSSLFQAVVFTFLVIDLTTFRVLRDLGTCNKCHLSNGLYYIYLVKHTVHCTKIQNNYEEHTHRRNLCFCFCFPSLSERSAHFGSTTNTARHAKSAKLEDGAKKQQATSAQRLAQWAANGGESRTVK